MLGEEESRREATRSIATRLISRCEELLSRVDESRKPHALTSKECFELWSSLGELQHDTWSKDMSRTEMDDLDTTRRKLLRKFSQLPETRLLPCLEDGIEEALEKIRRAWNETKHHLKTGGIGHTLTSYEFDLLFLRDSLGYAMRLVTDLNLTVQDKLLKRIESMDRELKAILPDVIRQFRAAEDDPTPYPENFPDFFWWRRIPHGAKTS